MFRPLKRFTPSPGLAVATVAVVLAAGGTATAANSLIGSSQVRNNSLTSSDIRDGSVRGTDLRNGTVTLGKISPSTRTALKGQQGPPGQQGQQGIPGTAAAKGDPGQKGDKGDQGDKGDAGAPATRMFAVVNADATLARGSGVVSVAKVNGGLGRYEILFDRSVLDCAYVSQIGVPDNQLSEPGFVRQAARSGKANGAFVGTFDTSANAADRPFHIAVFC